MKDVEQTHVAYFHADACDLGSFARLVKQELHAEDLSYAEAIQKNIPIYNVADLRATLDEGSLRRSIMAEWAHVLRDQAGVMVLKKAYADTALVDQATAIYNDIIAAEKQKIGGGGDHFAKAGSNDRIWNSLQKLCEASPEVFARYFGNPAISAVCEAWLGPSYQITAQINLVHPGGAAQQAHRDYHLGFQPAEISAQYPAHVHELSPMLTLQGAVAHCDMPVQSGPTKLLPFSQLYRSGYAAWPRADFRAYFEENYAQLPLSKGDAVFFNPALFHAAGANTSVDIQRMANLLQISSAFGRAMESIDRVVMSERLYPVLRQMKNDGRLSHEEITAAVAACAEGYSFPTNLDRDPPLEGLAPQTQQALILQAIEENWPETVFSEALAQQSERRQP